MLRRQEVGRLLSVPEVDLLGTGGGGVAEDEPGDWRWGGHSPSRSSAAPQLHPDIIHMLTCDLGQRYFYFCGKKQQQKKKVLLHKRGPLGPGGGATGEL